MVCAEYEDRTCILKVVQLQLGQALCKVAEILRCLAHPNINFIYLHFPFARHGDLWQYLGLQASLSASAHISTHQLRRMARQLDEAIAYLAERSVVHSDIKPANVLIDEASDCTDAPKAIMGDFDVGHTASGRTATLTLALQTRGLTAHYSAG